MTVISHLDRVIPSFDNHSDSQMTRVAMPVIFS